MTDHLKLHDKRDPITGRTTEGLYVAILGGNTLETVARAQGAITMADVLGGKIYAPPLPVETSPPAGEYTIKEDLPLTAAVAALRQAMNPEGVQ